MLFRENGLDAARGLTSEVESVLTEPRDGVLLITINRPDARNAVNLAVAEGIASALDRLDADDELRVGVRQSASRLTSSGSSSPFANASSAALCQLGCPCESSA